MSTLSTDLQLMQKASGGFSPNLFEVTIFGNDSYSEEDNYSFDKFPAKATGTLSSRFLCTKVALPKFSLSFEERHKTLKEFYIKEAVLPDEVTVTWLETHTLDVWRYHTEWLSYFYNRQKDQFVSGTRGKKRTMEIRISDTPDSSGEISEDDFHIFTVEGMIPVANAAITLDWSWGGDNTQVPVTYKVDRVKYSYKGEEEILL